MSLDDAYPQRFADAVARVVEQARWDARIGSVRELARQAGMTHTSLNARLNLATPFTVKDLAAIAPVLGVEPVEILRRAREAADGLATGPGGGVTSIVEAKTARRVPPEVQSTAARRPLGKTRKREAIDDQDQVETGSQDTDDMEPR